MSTFRWNIAQWFELKWWKRYANPKDTTTYLNWKKDYWYKFLNSVDLSDAVEPIIDIGCGPAGIFTILQNQHVVALDPLLDSYENEVDVFQKSHYPNTTFVCNSFENFSYPTKFQTIFCLNAINHFKNLDASFDKLAAISESDSKLVLSIDAHNYTFFKYLFRLLPLDILHPHQYNKQEYINKLVKSGFEIVNTHIKKEEFFFNYIIITAKRK